MLVALGMCVLAIVVTVAICFLISSIRAFFIVLSERNKTYYKVCYTTGYDEETEKDWLKTQQHTLYIKHKHWSFIHLEQVAFEKEILEIVKYRHSHFMNVRDLVITEIGVLNDGIQNFEFNV